MSGHAAAAAAATSAQSQQSAAEFTHLAVTFSDCVEALPPTITRSISDLRELDAVLSGSLGMITEKLNTLLGMLEQGKNDDDDNNTAVTSNQRFSLLREIAEEARSFRLGGEDKIRVATGTCETLIHHTNQLDIIANLLTTLLPASMAGTIPPPTWPHGYPVLFPTPASASGSAYRKPDYLPSHQVHGKYTALNGGANSLDYYPVRSANVYNSAADAVRNYAREGVPLPNNEWIQSQIAASQAGPPSLHGAHHKRQRTTTKDRPKGIRGAASSSNLATAAVKGYADSMHDASATEQMEDSGAETVPLHSGSAVPLASTSSMMPVDSTMAGDGTPHHREDSNFIPYANANRGKASLDAVAENAAAFNASNDSMSVAAPPKKRRQVSGKVAEHYDTPGDYDMADDTSATGAQKKERQNSGRSSAPLQSPVVGSAGQNSNGKRSRQTSKRGVDYSPDPGSPYLAQAGNGKGPSRKASMSVLADGSTAYDSNDAGEAEDHTALSHRSASRNSSSRQQYTSGLGVPPLVHDHPNIHGSASVGHPRTGSDDDSDGPEEEELEMLEPEIGIEGEGFDEGDDGQQLYCYCNRVSFGNMIGCDDEACQKEWFHLQCVGLSTPPKGEWYCDECQIRREAQAKTQAKKRRT